MRPSSQSAGTFREANHIKVIESRDSEVPRRLPPFTNIAKMCRFTRLGLIKCPGTMRGRVSSQTVPHEFSPMPPHCMAERLGQCSRPTQGGRPIAPKPENRFPFDESSLKSASEERSQNPGRRTPMSSPHKGLVSRKGPRSMGDDLGSGVGGSRPSARPRITSTSHSGSMTAWVPHHAR
jgi:hypothetical protein